MQKSLSSLIGTLMMAGAVNTYAASTVDLSVRGSITPSACVASLSNGGAVDLGKISASELSQDQHTFLPRETLQMSLACEAETLVAIGAKDNREGTESSGDYYNFGLGLINGSEKLGYLTIDRSRVLADGVTARSIGSVDGGLTWSGERSFIDNGILSVAAPATSTPIPVKLLTADLDIIAAIAPAKNLTLNNEVPIDGSVTFTVHYL